MKFYKNSTVTYPFTALYFGYMADLGHKPKLYANLFSAEHNQLIEFDSLVDLQEVSQVSDEVLFVGTIYINKLGNSLDIGSYNIKLSVQTPSNIVDLLYLPVEVIENEHKFHVSYIAKSDPSPDELRFHLRNIVEPGIKHGYNVTPSAESYFYDVAAGDLYTKNGCKLGHRGTLKAFKVDRAAAHPRVDAMCVYFDETRLDKNGDPSLPSFRVLKGIEDGTSMPPTIPPNYTVIRYAIIPANTSSPTQITLSNVNPIPGRRPFFTISSINFGNGTRDIFEFPIELVKGTSEIQVDGVPQFRDEDYSEIYIGHSKTFIRFIGEVPELGQTVTMSGQRNNGPYYDYDYSPYYTPTVITPIVSTHSRVGLMAEFLGEVFTERSWVDTSGSSMGFSSTQDLSPIKGWNGDIGHYLAFNGSSSLVMPQTVASVIQDEFTVAIKMDLRDSVQSPNWMRVLGVQGALQLFIINTAVDTAFIADYGSTRLTRVVPRWAIDLGSGVMSLSRGTDNVLTLKYNSFPASANGVTPVSIPLSAITLGQNHYEILAPGFNGLITKALFYNRPLNGVELADI